MRQVGRKAGVAGGAAVTLVTALFAGVFGGSGTSAASASRAGSESPTAHAVDARDAAPVPGTADVVRGVDARGGMELAFSDRFAPPRAFDPPRAATYDRDRVPAGAGIQVRQRVGAERTTVRIAVHGLAPHYRFGVHVHTKPCGARPDDSGPHYQNVKDPRQPSTDPRYANPHNEVWLDLTTDAEGDGGAVARHDWTFRRGEARSVVVHEQGTHTGPGHAGQAGDRLACFSVPFAGSAGDDD